MKWEHLVLAVGVLFLLGTRVPAEAPQKIAAVNGKCPRRYTLKGVEECAPSELCRDHSMPARDGSCPEDTPTIESFTCATTFRDIPGEAQPSPTPSGCGKGSSSRAPRRHLFVSHGRVADALHKYLDEAERHQVPLSLDTLSVYYFDAQNQQKSQTLPVKPGWAMIFSDSTPIKRWDHLLTNEVAQARPDPTSDAAALGADLVCGD